MDRPASRMVVSFGLAVVSALRCPPQNVIRNIAERMTPADEQELRRVSALLAAIDAILPEASPLREGLVKAGLALGIAFIDGRRSWIEDTYTHLDDDLSEVQRNHLASLGIDPDSDPADA